MKPQYERIADLIYEEYGDRPDFPWREFPEYEVFRHKTNRKWYGLIMNIPPKRLYAKHPSEKPRLPESLEGKSEIRIMDLKMPPDEAPGLDQHEGIFPAYHMDARHWISALLEDTLADDFIMRLVRKSYELTK